MEPRSKRIKRKQQQAKKFSQKKVTYSIVISVTIVGISQSVGSTFAQFTDTAPVTSQITTCELFPNNIVQILEELNGNLETLNQLMNRLNNLEVPAYIGTTYEIPKNATSKELLAVKNLLDQYLSDLDSMANTVKVNIKESKQLWFEINEISKKIVEETNQLVRYSKTYSLNCLELENEEMFATIGNTISTSMLPDETKKKLMVVIEYYIDVYQAGVQYDTEVNAAPQRNFDKEVELKNYMQEMGITTDHLYEIELQDVLTLSITTSVEQKRSSLLSIEQTVTTEKVELTSIKEKVNKRVKDIQNQEEKNLQENSSVTKSESTSEQAVETNLATQVEQSTEIPQTNQTVEATENNETKQIEENLQLDDAVLIEDITKSEKQTQQQEKSIDEENVVQ